MIKKLHFTDTDESKLFVSGCLHLRHAPKWEVPIWKMRGFNSSEEMTDGIIASINDTCRESDVLFVLGDFCLNTSEGEFIELINRIKPKMWFINGNHPNPWQKMYYAHCIEKFGYEVLGYEWLNKIIYLGDYVELVWNKQMAVCNHYPMLVWNHMSHGVWSLVSHSHGSCELTLPDNKSMKQLDCGWDLFRKPLGFEEIKNIMDKKDIAKNDRH